MTQRDGQLWRDGQPYYFVGTNFWYGAILGSKGQGGDRGRLNRELDFLKEQGIDNLRILVGADGERGVKTKVEPTLQIAPGVYNDTILDGLDYLLTEMGRRGMVAVLYLNNSWEWSGGYGFYLEQAGEGKTARRYVRLKPPLCERRLCPALSYADCRSACPNNDKSSTG